MIPPLAVTWVPRARPRAATCVAGSGAVAKALLEKLLVLDDDRLAALRAVGGDEVVAVLGAADDLPWVDEAEWCGPEQEAPSLLLPTAYDPSVPPPLLERAIRRTLGARSSPVVVLAGAGRLVPVGRARAPERGRVLALVEAMEASDREGGRDR